LLAAGCRGDVEASLREHSGDDRAYLAIVLDEEDALAGAAGGRVRNIADWSHGPALREGKVDFERRPRAGLAVDPDRAAALVHDAVHRRETETRPLRLGRE